MRGLIHFPVCPALEFRFQPLASLIPIRLGNVWCLRALAVMRGDGLVRGGTEGPLAREITPAAGLTSQVDLGLP